jgi:hypothetical protein
MIFRNSSRAVLFLFLGHFTQGAEWTVPEQRPSIQAALDGAAPGDVILVSPGVYRENLDFQGKNVAVRSLAGPSGTIIDAQEKQGVLIGPGGVFEGFTVTNAAADFGAAMQVTGAGSLIRGNVFRGNSQGAGGYGAAIGGNSASPIIEQNLFIENRADDQHLSGVVSFVNSSSPRIANNLFFSNPARAINLTLPEEAQPVVINNTIVGNTVGIHVDGRMSTAQQTYRNNILLNNEAGFSLAFAFEPGPIWEHNLVFGGLITYDGIDDPTGQRGNLSVDPLFRDASLGDFQLLPDSPAIDAGTPAGAPSVDFLNRPRPADGNLDGVAQVDMGAFEFFPAPPPPPSGLTGVSAEGEVALSWLELPDADSYEVKRAEVSGGPYETIGMVSEAAFVDRQVSNGVSYFYAVTARNRFGESAPSDEVMVTPGNRPPLARDDDVTTAEDTPVVIDLLANDSDPDGDEIFLVSLSAPQNGAVQINEDGTVTYTPAQDFHGTDEFTYRISDSGGLEATARVTITVTPVNDPPVALDQFRAFIGDASISIQLEGTDVDGDPLTFLLLQSPEHGLISGFDLQSGTLTYTPAHGFAGTDRFTFLVSDGLTNSPPGTVQLAVSLPRDVDRNGIPDYWEVMHDIKNREDDRDLDGMTNYQEYIANTNPRDPNSVLRLLSIETNSAGHFILTWASSGAVRYRVQFTNGAANGSYQPDFADIPRSAAEEIDPNPPGAPAVMTFTDDFSRTGGNPRPGTRYYRIRVVQ